MLRRIHPGNTPRMDDRTLEGNFGNLNLIYEKTHQ
jgi:hypothetical protein